MRVGLIAPPWVAVPPAGYGGTEAVVDNLARGLEALGHTVELFTIGESTCPVEGAEVCLVTSAACVPSSALLLGRR